MRSSLFVKAAALLMVGATLFVTASCSLTGDDPSEESTTEPPVVTMEARPDDDAAVLEFFNRNVNRIKAEKPGVESGRSASVRDVDTGDCPEAGALIQFAKTFSDVLDGPGDSAEYGADLNDFLPLKGTPTVSRLTPADIETIELTDDEDNRYIYNVHIVLRDGDASGAVANAFDLDVDKSEVLGTFTNYQNILEVSDYDVSYSGCEIHARINKETNRIEGLYYTLNSIVTAEVNFTGTLASLGETPVTFRLEQHRDFENFVWDAPTETESQAG